MTVLYRSSSVQMNVAGTNQNSITVTKPSATAEGDVMIAVTTQPSTTTTPPSGWTLLGSFTEAGNQEANVYRKIAGSSEPANYTWTFGSSSTCGVAIASFLGGHDVLLWDSRTNTATSVPFGRQLNAARDAVAWTVLSWRDTATSTFTPGQGVEKFDAVSNNTGATIFRGLTAAYYGPPDVNDIVNIGDGLPGTLFTSSGGALTEAFVIGLLISEKEPDNETWSSTNGDFGVELKLDQVDLNATGGISTPFRGDVTNSVTAFLESGESAPNVTENLADGLTTTRWLTNGDSGYVTYDFGSGNPKTIKRYRLTSASSSAERDPMNWTLEGSNDNSSFTVLDTRSNEGFANRSETNEFRVTTTGSYRYYKLNISSNQDPATATAVHLAEFRLSTHDVWEDVTSYVQEESKIRITRGLQGSSGRSDFSRAYVELRNTDGRFSIRNQDGAYFGSLQRNSQMRISKAYGTKALQLQGDVQLEGTDMCGDCARTPLTDVLSILGDIDVRIDLEPESWRDEQMLAGVAPAVDGHEGWSFYLDDSGILHLTWSDGTSFFDVSSELAVPQGNRQAVRVTLDVDNGASGKTITFYRADTISGEWTQLGGIITQSGTTAISYTGGALSVGHVQGRSQRGIHGLVYGFELYEGIAGTLRSSIDFTSLANGAHTFTDSSSRQWITVNNSVVSNRRYRFHGEVSEWPLYWDTTGNWVACSATGAGVQKRLERGAAQDSAYRRFHTKGIIPDPGAFERFAEPNAYWPMEDGPNTVRIGSALSGKPLMEVYGAPSFAAYSDFDGSDPVLTLKNAKLGGRVSGNAAGYADIRFLMHSSDAITANANILTLYSSGSIRKWEVDYQAANLWRIRGYDEDALDTGVATVSASSIAMTTIGEKMSVRLVLDQNGADISFTIDASDPYDDDLGGTTATFSSQTLGRVYRINVNDDDAVKMNEVSFGHLALYDSVDAPAFEGPLRAYAYETAGERAKRICDEEEIEFRHVGGIAKSALLGSQTTESAFAAMSTGASSDDGYLVDPLDAFGIEYRTNRSLYGRAAHLTLDYDAGELSGELRPTSDDSYITNDFTASRGDAGSARFRRTDGALSMNNPPDGVGSYAESGSFSFAHEGQCIQMASWQVHKGTLDEERFPRIQLALENLRVSADSALTESILTLDIGKRIDITDVPDWLPAEDIRQVVVGYEEWFDNFQHNFSLNTIPERIFEVAEYDAGWNFDTESADLYQDISASTTTVTVQTNTGQPWTDDPSSFPFLLRVDGEAMKAIAPGSLSNLNPFFEGGVTGWDDSNATAVFDGTVMHPNPLSIGTAKVTPDGSLGNARIVAATGVDVTPQNNYKAVAWVYNPDGYDSMIVEINWHDSGGVYISSSSSTPVAINAGEWTFLEVEGTAPATAAEAKPQVAASNSPTASEIYWTWGVLMTESHAAYDASWAGDSFNRADSTTNLGSTDGAGTVIAWTQNSGTWGINGNAAYISAAATSVATILGSASLDEVALDVPTWASGSAAVVFRFTDTSNYIWWGGTVGTVATLNVVSGGATTTHTPDSGGTDWTLAAGDRLSARCNGSVIEVFRNGLLALTISTTANQSATRVGMRLTTTAPRIDNFYVQAAQALQDFQVERGWNGSAKPHKSEAAVSLYRPPFRAL